MSVASQITVKDAASRKLEKIAAAYTRMERAAQRADTVTSAGGADVSSTYGRVADSVDRAGQEVDQFNNKQRRAAGGADQVGAMWNRVKRYVASAAAAFGVQKLAGLSDTVSGINARLALITKEGESVAAVNDKIHASAMRARASYTETAAAVSKLGLLAGKAFSSTDEMLAFSELMNKNFVIGGAGQAEQASAMHQLTQAMASGRLQGDEYVSIIENAPLLAASIEDYMRNVQGATGSMKEWASEGRLTADVIKASLFSSADQVEARFKTIPMTWGQVWTMAGNIAIRVLNPLLLAISWLANNISIIGPLVLGLGAAFAIFLIAANWINICKGVTQSLMAAQKMLTAAMATSWALPLIVIAIVIGALYAIVAVFNKVTGSTLSATGIIAGAFAVLGAFLFNSFVLPLWNAFASLSNFIGNVFQDPAAAVKVLFYDMMLNVLGYIQNIAAGIEGLINKIPGIEVNITGGIDALYDRVSKASQEVKDKSEWVEYVQSKEFMDYGDAAKAGYDFGAGLASKAAGLFGGAGAGLDWDALQSGVGDIAANTGALADEVNIADEDLKFLRDVAEMRYIQNFVTLTPTVAMNASISERVDVNTVVSAIERKLEEEFAANAEGVYA